MANAFKHLSENSGQTKLPQPEKVPTKGDTNIFKTSEDKEFLSFKFLEYMFQIGGGLLCLGDNIERKKWHKSYKYI